MITNEELKRRLYVSNFDEWKTDCQMNFFSDKELTVKYVEHGIILPPVRKNNPFIVEYVGGVCDEEFNFIDGFYRTTNKRVKLNLEIRESYKCVEDEINYIDEDVIYGGFLKKHFGHIIFECLGRIWYILQNPSHKEKIAFIINDGNIADGYICQIFDLLDISDRVMIVDKPTKFRSVIVPEASIYSWSTYMKEFFVPYNYIANKIKPSPYKKIYLTRSQYTKNPIINEEYFEEYFSNHGYKVISPEKFSVEEQISFVSAADEVATTLGTLSHFALFCKPGTKFIILLRISDDLLLPQCLINEARKIDYYIVDVAINFLGSSHVQASNLIGTTFYWKQFVKDHFGDLNVKDDSFEKHCLEYLLNWGKLCLNPNTKSPIAGTNFIRNMDTMSFLRPLYNLLKYHGFSYELSDYLNTDLGKIVTDYDVENLVIFGSGNVGRNVLSAFKQSIYRDMPMYFCDNDRNKWTSQEGGGYCNLKVISPEELVKNFPKSLVVISIAGLDSKIAIHHQLVGLGFPHERIKYLSKMHTLEPIRF